MSADLVRSSRARLVAGLAAVGLAAVPALTANATAAVAAGGDATSGVTLLSLSAAGRTVKAVSATLGSDNLNQPSTASIALAPLTGTGADPAAVTYTQDTTNQPNVGAQTFSAAGILSITSPEAALSAARTATGALASIRTTLSGADGSALSVLGLKIPATVSLSTGSSVTDLLSSSSKELSVTNLALPSVGDLLNQLGLDLTKLPSSTVADLTTQLGLVPSTISSTVASLNTQIDAAQKAVDDQRAKLATLTSSLTDAKAAAAQAQAVFDAAVAAVATATTALNSAIAAINNALSLLTPLQLTPLTLLGLSLPLTQAQISANLTLITTLIGSALTSTFSTAVTNLASANAAQAVAQTALTAANAAVTTAQGLVDTAQTLLNSLVSTLTGLLNQLATLVPQLITALDNAALVTVGQVSLVSKAQAGSSHLADVSGTVKDVKVIGTDVLKTALGSSTLDVTEYLGTVANKVNSAISTVTGVVSSVLSNIPVIPGTPDLSGLKVPAPTVKLLSKLTTLAPIGGLEAARANVTALQISWPGLTIPAAALTPTALAGLTAGATSLVSSPVDLTVGVLSDVARFRPAQSATTPSTPSTPSTPGGGSTPTGSGTPTSLPHTGGSPLLPGFALLMVAAAYGVRRWRQAVEVVDD